MKATKIALLLSAAIEAMCARDIALAVALGGPSRWVYPRSTPSRESTMPTPVTQPPTILIVDDDPEALILLRRLLLSITRH